MFRAHVPRPRLSRVLDAALHVPVTLVCGGAGWGKTVLVSTWLDDRPFPVAWLTADRADDDVQSFWSGVVTALRAAGAVPHGDPPEEWHGVRSAARVRALAGGVLRLPTPTVMVIDDLQEFENGEVLRELGTLIDRPWPNLHLILISRSEPALPLYRLRLAGGLREIRVVDLAFTAEEAALLFTRLDLRLDGNDVVALLERTQGWPAGLQMAADFLTAPGGPHRISEFAGDVRPVDEYLTNEVLAELPPRTLRFLLCTSISEQLCGDLADAITLDDDGRRILEELELAGDFVVRLGARPLWFRYHRLLRDVLRHHLALECAPRVPELHGRAARWHLAHGSIHQALGHASAGGDWPLVGRVVVAQAVPLILSSDGAALVRALRGIPAAESATTAELTVCAALLLFDAGDWDAIPERLVAARGLLQGRPEEERTPVETAIRALELGVHGAIGDMPAVVAETTRLLTALSRFGTAEIPAAAQYRAIALTFKGVGLFWLGQTDLAERFLWNASTAARAAGTELVEINAVGHRALLEIMYGSVQEATRLATAALDLAERGGWRSAWQTVAAHLAMTLVHVGRRDLAQAEGALQQGRRALCQEPEAAQQLAWLGCQAELALARGEPSVARAVLAQARRQQGSRIRAPALDRWLLLIESRVDLRTGAYEAVEERYARVGVPTFAERVCQARAAFAVGELSRAEVLLAGSPAPLSETVTTVEAHVLTALIADARRQGLRAAAALAGAFALAEHEGLIAPFVAMAGGRLERLVRRQSLLTYRNTAFVSDVLKAMTATGAGENAAVQAGELSEREREVLSYLPTMLTAGDIAAELGVSINTVKAHLRSIYRKLNVARRREAVTHAREHGLI
ncbi:LuxR transcriptional regulator [Couchioplanes caeruleus subsp. caeruleus]|uniref:LuxR transcriptional regulator n=2 Tax=Couchioplanes caeruleus TaxID=56438 RepID=A0A1K0FU78_9ACTN|nr:LuxR transcriptional regulator [Couchioplanes caeruleus subsp. caeruleus]